jgi:hypothetical protein
MSETTREDEIRERCDKATAGPWKVVEGKSFGVQSENKNIACCFRPENEQFIAHSRKDIPYLLTELARLRAENARLRAKLDDPRTVTLPCAVGTTVYVVVTDCDCAYDGDMNACSECDYVIMPCDDFFRYDENEWECGFKPHVREDKFTLAMYDDFGKTVFLTREAAEAAKEATPHG